MNNIFKRVQILSLAVLVGLGTTYTVNRTALQNPANKQYVLSNYFPNQRLIRKPQVQISKGSTSTSTVTLPENTQESSNWGGYIVTPNSDNSYTNVSGSWTIPSIKASNLNAVAAQWVGLGGVTSSDLLQMGTIEQIENSQPVAEIFWEQLPNVAQNVMTVPIGSTINVSISESSSSTWNLTFTCNEPDGTTQTQTVSTTLDSAYVQGIGTSAEWISEDPSDENGQLVPLADMGTVKYKSAMVNGESINASDNNVEPVAMVSNSRTVVISPSALGSDGESFTTTNTNSTAANTTTSSNSSTSTAKNRKQGFPFPPGNFNQSPFSWNWR